MLLKRLTLQGFKSFADRTTIEFCSGITAIIGPNGCGKSNIVEAFKWILGEHRASSLRSERQEEIIFAGSQVRKPSGMAEVSLLLENDGLLSFPPGDVEVKRRIFRGGEAEFFINGSKVRLKDIKSLFWGTGLFRGAYAIIEQGEISNIITANSHRLRFYLEEAAGITGFRERKREALLKLEAVQQDLEKILIKLQEMEERLQELEEQAQKAEKYRKLESEITRLENIILRRKFTVLNEKIKKLNNKKEKLNKILKDLQIERENLKNQLDKSGSELEKKKETLQELRLLKNELQNRLVFLGRELDSREKNKEKLLKETQELEERLKKLEKELLWEREEVGRASKKWEDLKQKAEEKRKQLDAMKHELNHLRNTIKKQEEEKKETAFLFREWQRKRQRAQKFILELNERHKKLKSIIPQFEQSLEDLKSLVSQKETIQKKKQELLDKSKKLWKELTELSNRKKYIEEFLKENFVPLEQKVKIKKEFMKLWENNAWLLNVVVEGNEANLEETGQRFLMLENSPAKNLTENNLALTVETSDSRIKNFLSQFSLEEATRGIRLRGLKVVDGSSKKKLKLKKELEEINLRLSRLDVEYKETEETLRVIEEKLSGILDAEKRMVHLRTRLESMKRELKTVEEEIEKTESFLKTPPPKVAEVSKELVEKLQKLVEEYHHLEADFHSTAAEMKKAEGIYSSLKARIPTLEDLIPRLRASLNQKKQEMEENSQKINELKQQIEETEVKLSSVSKSLEESEVEVEKEQQILLEIQRKYQEVDRKVIEEESMLAGISQRLQELLEERENLLNETEFTRGFSLTGDISEEEARKAEIELKKMRKEIKTLGEVNFAAASDYRRLKAKYEELKNHYQDVFKARENLLLLAQRIEKEASEKFRDTLENLQDVFHKNFARLFGGGKASITVKGPLLEAPLEIGVQIPGKKIKSLHLLSGGEKALAGVALILSLIQIKAPPFCILDEVDAPLDETNTDRFINILNEVVEKTQVIIITHNKRTMAAAGTIYGITMEEPGVSKVLSVNLEAVK